MGDFTPPISSQLSGLMSYFGKYYNKLRKQTNIDTNVLYKGEGKDWERKEASRARGLEGKLDGT